MLTVCFPANDLLYSQICQIGQYADFSFFLGVRKLKAVNSSFHHVNTMQILQVLFMLIWVKAFSPNNSILLN